MFPKIKFDKLFCGLDLGSQKIKAAMLKLGDRRQMELIATRENDVQGFKDLVVSDLGELTECIRKTVDGLSQEIGIRFKDIQLGLGTELVDERLTGSVIPLVDKGHKVITARDMDKATDQAKLLGTKMDEEVLHNIPQNYVVDDINSVLTPLGLYGRKLGVQSLMIVTHMSRIKNIIKAVNQAGYDVANIFLSSYVASEMVLTDQDKLQGCILVDIGSKVTTVQIYVDRILKFIAKVPVGGDYFTRSISNQLTLSFDLAEQIKKSYAAVLGAGEFRDEEILLKRESNYIPVKREAIYQAIEPPSNALVDHIRQVVSSSGLSQEINCGITMTGGGALLPGLLELIEKQTNFPVRLGHISMIPGQGPNQGAVFAGAAGLAFNGYKKTFTYYLADRRQAKQWPKKAMDKLVDLYQDYF